MRFTNTTLRLVAILHDVLEDSSWGPTQLLANGIPKEVVDAVIALTKLNSETYMEYIDRLSENELARKVKIADLNDNIARSHNLDSNTKKYLLGKYLKAYNKLHKYEDHYDVDIS